MKLIYVILVLALLGGCASTNPVLTSTTETELHANTASANENDPEVSTINNYFGHYVGFSPTDQSPTRIGEMQITLDSDYLVIKFATGLEVLEGKVATSKLRQLSLAEVSNEFEAESQQPRNIDGFQVMSAHHEDLSGIILLFWRTVTDHDARLIVLLGQMSQILGHTMLYDEKQVEEGMFTLITDHLDENFGEFTFPRISYDGKLRPE